jgi:hypothetical protein
MPHVSEKYFGVIFIAGQAVQLLAWGRGRVMGLTEVRPRRFDRCVALSLPLYQCTVIASKCIVSLTADVCFAVQGSAPVYLQ